MTLLIEPQQERSKKSLERLLDASARQIALGNFESVSVADITKNASCSVGTFYGRFQNKAALFHVVQERSFQASLNVLTGKIDRYVGENARDSKRPTLKQAADFLVKVAVELYSDNRGLFRALFLHTRTQQDSEANKRVENFNRSCMHAGLNILRASQGDSLDKSLEDKWQKAVMIVAVYLRESILFGPPVVTGTPHPFEEMKCVAATMLANHITALDD